MAYVIIVEFRAKPERIDAFAELIDRHAHNSLTLEDDCLAFDVCQDPKEPSRFVLYEVYRDEAAHRRHLEMDSFRRFRERAPQLVVPGSENALPHHRQVLTRRTYLSE